MKFMNVKKKFYAVACAVPATLALAVSSFASEGTTGVAITGDMLKPIITGVTANIGAIMPAAITLFSIMIGISLVPKIIKLFRK